MRKFLVFILLTLLLFCMIAVGVFAQNAGSSSGSSKKATEKADKKFEKKTFKNSSLSQKVSDKNGKKSGKTTVKNEKSSQIASAKNPQKFGTPKKTFKAATSSTNTGKPVETPVMPVLSGASDVTGSTRAGETSSTRPSEVIGSAEAGETSSTESQQTQGSGEVAASEGKKPQPEATSASDVHLAEEQTPRITAIEVKGNEHVPTDEILKVVRSKVGDPLLEPRLRSDVQSIFEMGFFTDVKVDTPYFAGGMKIVFRVQENPVVIKITVLGNKMVTTEKLRELMQTREGKILNMKTLNTDMNEINYYYNETLSYTLEPTHIKNVNWTPSGELILEIQEGMKIEKIQIIGSSLFSEEKLKSLIKMQPGMLFNSKEIKEDSTRISNFYEEEDYILDTIRPQVNYKTGEVTIQVLEAVVEDIKLEFDKEKHKTKEYVVMRNIRTKKGEVLQRKKLQRDIERLSNLGYFSKVNVDPEPGSKPGYMVLVFKLKEQKTGLATIGVGYTGGGSGALRSGITGALSYSEKNLGGTGQEASAAWQRGVNIDSVSGSYYNPAINNNQDSFGVTLFRHNYLELRQPVIDNPDRYALYDDKRQGGTATYGRRITDELKLFLSYRTEKQQIGQNPKSEFVPVGISTGRLNSLGIGSLYDTRNDIFDPTSGFYGDMSFSYAGNFLGGTYDFRKYSGEVRKYFPLGKKQRSTIALRLWGGLIKGNASITESFYVGGTDTIRGYNENEFYGTRMAVLNAEYRFPIANIKFLKGAIFADAGNAWFPNIGRSRLYTDAGAGLRIVFPTLGLGVIRVDYARGERGGRTSIGIGQTF